jgi:hypothetical protein
MNSATAYTANRWQTFMKELILIFSCLICLTNCTFKKSSGVNLSIVSKKDSAYNVEELLTIQRGTAQDIKRSCNLYDSIIDSDKSVNPIKYHYKLGRMLHYNNEDYTINFYCSNLDEESSMLELDSLDIYDSYGSKSDLFNGVVKYFKKYNIEYHFYRKDIDSLSIIRLIDLNFDSIPDFQIYDRLAGGSSGTYYYTWLYNGESKSLVYDTLFSRMPLGSIDYKRKIISLGASSGFGNFIEIRLQYSNGKYIQIEKVVSDYNSKTNLQTIHRSKLYSGKFKDTIETYNSIHY